MASEILCKTEEIPLLRSKLKYLKTRELKEEMVVVEQNIHDTFLNA